MGSDNSKIFIKSSDDHVANLNCALKSIKSDTIVEFICINHCSLIVTANKIAILSELYVVENYIKNTTFVDSNDIQSACLPQSKSYLKILDIFYLIESTNMPINSSVVESIIKSTHIFDNVHIVSKPCIIKVSPKSDMAIIWINIWDSQSGTSTKMLIN